MRYTSAKKTISILTAAVIILSLLASMPAYRADALEYNVTGGKIYFDSQTGSITGADPTVTSVIIPSQIGGIPVTAIADFAFGDCPQLTSVTIGSAISSIGKGAFYGASELSYVTIAAGNTTYKTYGGMLLNYSGTGAILCPANTTGQITVASTVTDIAPYAFYGCDELKGITLPSGLKTVGEYAFYRCSELYRIDLPSTVTTLGTSVFENCQNLTRITLSDELTQLPAFMAANCPSLTYMTLTAKITAIGEGAFANCGSLASVDIPSLVASIASSAFSGCGLLQSISVSGSNTVFKSSGGVLFDIAGNTLLRCPEGMPGDYSVPGSVQVIAEGAFSGCSKLTGIDLAEGVQTLSSKAFEGCDGLITVNIPTTVTSIGDYAFSSCGALKTADILEGTLSIGKYAFAQCEDLSRISLPESAVQIGEGAFEGCRMLQSLSLPAGLSEISDKLFESCVGLLSITLPNVASIGSGAFAGCRSLTAITIPSGCVSVAASAFERCVSLSSISMQNGVETIGDSAFAFCGSLKEVSLPDSLTAIGNNAFEGCSVLSMVTFPQGMLSVGSKAFRNCINLSYIVFMGEATSPAGDSFEGCAGITVLCKADSVPAEFAQVSSIPFAVMMDKIDEALTFWTTGELGADNVLSLKVYAINSAAQSAVKFALGAYTRNGKKIEAVNFYDKAVAQGISSTSLQLDCSGVTENFKAKLFALHADGSYKPYSGMWQADFSADHTVTRFTDVTVNLTAEQAKAGNADITSNISAGIKKGTSYGLNGGFIITGGSSSGSVSGQTVTLIKDESGKAIFNSSVNELLEAGDSYEYTVAVYDDLAGAVSAQGKITINITEDPQQEITGISVSGTVYASMAGKTVTEDFSGIAELASVSTCKLNSVSAADGSQPNTKLLPVPSTAKAGDILTGYFVYTDNQGAEKTGALTLNVVAVPTGGDISQLLMLTDGETTARVISLSQQRLALGAASALPAGFETAGGSIAASFETAKGVYSLSGSDIVFTPKAAPGIGADEQVTVIYDTTQTDVSGAILRDCKFPVSINASIGALATSAEQVNITLDLASTRYLPVDVTSQVLAGVTWGTYATANKGIKGTVSASNTNSAVTSPDAVLSKVSASQLWFNSEQAKLVSGANYSYTLEVWDDIVGGTSKVCDITVNITITGAAGTITTASPVEVILDIAEIGKNTVNIAGDVLAGVSWGATANANKAVKGSSISNGVELKAIDSSTINFNNSNEILASGTTYEFSLEVWEDCVNDTVSTCFIPVSVTITGTSAPEFTTFPDLTINVRVAAANAGYVRYAADGSSIASLIYANVIPGPLWNQPSSTGSTAQPGWIIGSVSSDAGSVSGKTTNLVRSNGNTTTFNTVYTTGIVVGDEFHFTLDIYDHLSEDSSAVDEAKLTIKIVA